MTDHYVDVIVDKVTLVCQESQISEGAFWHWLGNKKFQQDNGHLTLERANEIMDNLSVLLNEYLEEQ